MKGKVMTMGISEYRKLQIEQKELNRKLDEIAMRKARQRHFSIQEKVDRTETSFTGHNGMTEKEFQESAKVAHQFANQWLL